MNVLFAPDYRELVPYQQALANALAAHGAEVEFRPGYRRLLPLYRSVTQSHVDVFHLHWIEHLFPRGHLDTWRKRRFPHDLHWATRRTPLVYTVHDLYPIGWPHDAANTRLVRELLQEAEALILHWKEAQDLVCKEFGAKPAMPLHSSWRPRCGLRRTATAIAGARATRAGCSSCLPRLWRSARQQGAG